MLTVRPYQKKDLGRLREICLETSSFRRNDTKTTAFLWLMYCDYYALCEPESVFVAADETDTAQGYILCAKDFKTYRRRFRAFFQPQADALGPYFFGIVRGEMFVHSLLSRRYPAHLHIDLSAAARHQGTGTRLMDALKAYLQQTGCPGVMLLCGADNKNAVQFYLRNGFRIRCRFFGSYLMTFDF